MNMNGYFVNIDKDPSLIKSSGIIILISATKTSNSYNTDMVINATNFVKYLTEQKTGAINSVAGYSLGGPYAGTVANQGNYQRLLIFDGDANKSFAYFLAF